MPLAEVAKLVDAADSKSAIGNSVWVRLPPSVLSIMFYTLKEEVLPNSQYIIHRL